MYFACQIAAVRAGMEAWKQALADATGRRIAIDEDFDFEDRPTSAAPDDVEEAMPQAYRAFDRARQTFIDAHDLDDPDEADEREDKAVEDFLDDLPAAELLTDAGSSRVVEPAHAAVNLIKYARREGVYLVGDIEAYILQRVEQAGGRDAVRRAALAVIDRAS